MSKTIMEPSFSDTVPEEDIILFAYILAKTPDWRLGKIDSNKLVFFIKWECHQHEEVLFRMQFIRVGKGPVSPFLKDIRGKFNETKFGESVLEIVDNHPRPTEFLSLTEDSYLLLDWIESITEKYSWVFDQVDKFFDKYFGIPWQTRQDFVYKLVVAGKTIEEYNPNIKERIPMPYLSDWKIFNLTPEDRQDFHTLFNIDNRYKLLDQDNNNYFLGIINEFFENSN